MATEYFDAPAHPNLATQIIRKLARSLDGIDRAMAAGHTCSRLTNMSDAELARRGIRRDEIPKIVIRQLLGRDPAPRGH